jgi:hypothetical protein
VNKRFLVALVVGALSAPGAVALAAPGTTGPPDEGGTRPADCIQTLYGNTTNPRPGGHGVLPSQSPGPFLNDPQGPNEPPRNDRTRGPSVGDLARTNQQQNGNNAGGVPAGCAAASG